MRLTTLLATGVSAAILFANAALTFGQQFVYHEKPPALVHMPTPVYPAAARRARIQGTVKVQALIDKTGKVVETRVVVSIPQLDSAAVDAVRKSTWKPAQAGGHVTREWVEYPVRFALPTHATLESSKPPSAIRSLAPVDSGTSTMDTLGSSPDSLTGRRDTGPDSMAQRRRMRRGDGLRPPAFGDLVYYEEAPVLQYMPRPRYPGVANQSGNEGVVKVQALVDTLGMVVDTRVVRSIPLLDQAAVDAVRQSRWRPAFNNRRPVAVWVEVPVRFTADGR